MGDTTLTFIQAYQATPAAILSGGEATNLQVSIAAITAGSIRIVTRNSSNTATAARKCGVLITGIF